VGDLALIQRAVSTANRSADSAVAGYNAAQAITGAK